MWSRCSSSPWRSPPNHSSCVSGPRPMGNSSQPRAHCPVGRVHVEPGRGEAVREDLVDDRLQVPLRAARIRGRDEVVGVGDVEALDPRAVQPRVAEVAAGEKPAIRRGGIPHREARPPPDVGLRLPIDLRHDNPRLAVTDVANGNVLDGGRTGNPQEHRRLVAERGRRLGHVQLRPVVVRELEEDRHAATPSPRRA